VRLDNYLKKNNLKASQVARVFDSKDEAVELAAVARASSSGADLQVQAELVLSALFSSSSYQRGSSSPGRRGNSSPSRRRGSLGATLSYEGDQRPPSPTRALSRGRLREQNVPLPLPSQIMAPQHNLSGAWASRAGSKPSAPPPVIAIPTDMVRSGAAGAWASGQHHGVEGWRVVDDDEERIVAAREGMARHTEDRAQATWPVLPPNMVAGSGPTGAAAHDTVAGQKREAGGGLNSDKPKMNPLAKCFDITDTKVVHISHINFSLSLILI